MKQEAQQLKAPKQPNDVVNKVEMCEGKDQSRRMNGEMIKQLSDGERRKVDILFFY